jgi:hypothetical protein
MHRVDLHQGIGLIVLTIFLLTGCDRNLPLLQPDIPRPPPAMAIAATPGGSSAEAPNGKGQGSMLFTHVVRWPGETLAAMARWYTGGGGNWRRIAEVNPGLDPTRINIGDKIQIPGKLLKTRRPMPKTAVSTNARNMEETAPVQGPETATDILYGPIEGIPQISPVDEDTPLPLLETID